jgi:hypothetical protein
MSYRKGLALLVAASICLVGCTDSNVSIPNTPEGTVQAVAKALAEHKPQALWSAMPASYQKDVTGLIQTFAEKMDKEVYDTTFKVAGKLTQVLQEKKDFILSHPMLQQGMVKGDEVRKNWDSLVGLLDTLMGSEIKSIDSLKTLDVGKFLAGTGGKLMKQAADLSKMTPQDQMGKELDNLANIKVEVLPSAEGGTKLKISAPNAPEQEVEMVQVEGKWIPKQIADDWQDAMAKARKGLDEMKMGENKAQAMMMLGGIGGALDGLLAAKDQQEFNALAGQALGSILGGFMGGGMGAPGGAMMPPPGK